MESTNTDQMIHVDKIIKSYYVGTPNELEILHGISLDIREGEFVSIVGASGSGKSTFMNILGLLDRPTSGTYLLDGADMNRTKDKALSGIRNHKIGLNQVAARRPAKAVAQFFFH